MSLYTPLKACLVEKLTIGVIVGQAFEIVPSISVLNLLLTTPIHGRRITTYAVLSSAAGSSLLPDGFTVDSMILFTMSVG